MDRRDVRPRRLHDSAERYRPDAILGEQALSGGDEPLLSISRRATRDPRTRNSGGHGEILSAVCIN